MVYLLTPVTKLSVVFRQESGKAVSFLPCHEAPTVSLFWAEHFLPFKQSSLMNSVVEKEPEGRRPHVFFQLAPPPTRFVPVAQHSEIAPSLEQGKYIPNNGSADRMLGKLGSYSSYVCRWLRGGGVEGTVSKPNMFAHCFHPFWIKLLLLLINKGNGLTANMRLSMNYTLRAILQDGHT